MENSEKKSFSIISVQASVLNIEVVKNYANIKVKFLSKQREKPNDKTKNRTTSIKYNILNFVFIFAEI